jgi:hypothetical protein
VHTYAVSREIALCETLKLLPMSRIGSPASRRKERCYLLRGGPRAAYRNATRYRSGKNVDRALRASQGVDGIIEKSQYSLPRLDELWSPEGLSFIMG